MLQFRAEVVVPHLAIHTVVASEERLDRDPITNLDVRDALANRVGPEGLLQPLADLGKFVFKEDVIPGHVNRLMYVIAPTISLIPALVTFAVIPYTGQASDAAWRYQTAAIRTDKAHGSHFSMASIGLARGVAFQQFDRRFAQCMHLYGLAVPVSGVRCFR